VGSCIVNETASGGNSTSTPLDAGSLSVTVPGGASYPLKSPIKGVYDTSLPPGAITPAGGTYTFLGSGGADVGAFTAAVNLSNPLLKRTNQSAAATINRSQGLQVTWTGGPPRSLVIIQGQSRGTNGVTGSYACFVQQSALQFTVPAYVTGTLPAGTGTTMVENDSFSAFSAPGLDYAAADGITASSVNTSFQ